MMITISRKLFNSLLLLPLLLVVLAVAVPVSKASSHETQKSFSSPDEAVKSLVAALRNNDDKELVRVLGPGSETIVTSGDPVADKTGRERFIKLYDEKNVIERAETGRAVLSIGNEDYPFPIPIVKNGEVWRFDAKAGKDELLNRRIGRNELAVIDILKAYVDAQREYASVDRGTGALEFAQRIRSTPGKRDGLFWEPKEGEEESPFGPLAAEAALEGYSTKTKNEAPYPFHGYIFRILKAQGAHAKGGAFDYVVNGKMILGFAMVAYPAQYGASGIMTFIVNQDGVVYQKNLGKNTGKTAAAMKLYNPDASWTKVE